MSNIDVRKEKIIAPKERRLSELYVTGREVVFDDGEGEPLELWLQKLTPAETQEAVNRSRPAKSRITSIKRLPDDASERMLYFDQMDEYGIYTTDEMIAFLIQPKLNQYALSAEARVADEKEWSEDDYLTGLQNAWNEGLKDTYAADPEDADAARVFGELRKYTDQVQAEIDAEERELTYELQDLEEDELRKRIVNKLIEDHGDNALIEEFRRQQLFFATRLGSDHSKRYFQSREEVDSCQGPVYNKLVLTYIELSVDSFEGKDQRAHLIF